jgi:hypothetical protein
LAEEVRRWWKGDVLGKFCLQQAPFIQSSLIKKRAQDEENSSFHSLNSEPTCFCLSSRGQAGCAKFPTPRHVSKNKEVQIMPLFRPPDGRKLKSLNGYWESS